MDSMDAQCAVHSAVVFGDFSVYLHFFFLQVGHIGYFVVGFYGLCVDACGFCPVVVEGCYFYDDAVSF